MKLNEKDKIKIIFQIMIVIEYFHNNHFVYRDLKPSNILINRDKTVGFVDFDRMINLDDKQEDNYEFTNDFSSSFTDIILNYGFISYKNDIYSLGLLIYYVIMEEYPDENFQLDFPSKYSKLTEICKRCILNDPEKRPCISELIDFFYENFFKIIQVKDLFYKNGNDKIEDLMYLSEINTIKTTKNIHDLTFLGYWVNLSEYEYYKSQCFLYENYSPFEEEKLFQADEKKYIQYLILTANNGVDFAQYELAGHYYVGNLLEKDIRKAIYYFSLFTRKEFSYSKYIIGYLYFDGKEIPRNIDLSIYYLSLAAEHGIIEAQDLLIYIYFNGKYTKKDIRKTFYYCKLAAKQNSSFAFNVLGILYSNHIYNMYDIEKSLFYFNLAIQQNNSEAEFNLGCLYLNGLCVKKDIEKAIYLFTLSANQNNISSIIFLAYINFTLKKNNIEGFNYLQKAAKLNFPYAMVIVGTFYYNGNLVPRDVNKGLNYLELATKQNEPIAFYFLGCIFYDGIYVKKDLSKSFKYFSQASKNGIEISINFIGLIYLNPDFE